MGTFGMAVLGAMPLAAQGELTETAGDVSPFCEALEERVSPWDERPDLSFLSKAILLRRGSANARGGDLNQLCDWAGEQVLPLNFLLTNDTVLAQQLIEQGVDVNAKDGNGDTPLHYVGSSMENARSRQIELV